MRRTEFSARAGSPAFAAVFFLLVALLLVTALVGCLAPCGPVVRARTERTGPVRILSVVLPFAHPLDPKALG